MLIYRQPECQQEFEFVSHTHQWCYHKNELNRIISRVHLYNNHVSAAWAFETMDSFSNDPWRYWRNITVAIYDVTNIFEKHVSNIWSIDLIGQREIEGHLFWEYLSNCTSKGPSLWMKLRIICNVIRRKGDPVRTVWCGRHFLVIMLLIQRLCW